MESLESRFPARGTALIMGTKFFVRRYRIIKLMTEGNLHMIVRETHMDTWTHIPKIRKSVVLEL